MTTLTRLYPILTKTSVNLPDQALADCLSQYNAFVSLYNQHSLTGRSIEITGGGAEL